MCGYMFFHMLTHILFHHCYLNESRANNKTHYMKWNYIILVGPEGGATSNNRITGFELCSLFLTFYKQQLTKQSDQTPGPRNRLFLRIRPSSGSAFIFYFKLNISANVNEKSRKWSRPFFSFFLPQQTFFTCHSGKS